MMARLKNPNLEILRLTVTQLGELADEFVFVGGCATGLLISDPAAPPIRVTRDVDAIVQVASRAEYYRLSKRLRDRGFREDASAGAPLCRWRSDPLILDVMPTDESILGFGNPWYVAAIKAAEKINLETGESLSLVTSPYFLITKLDAFANRGKGDFQMSHDMEDVIAVLDGRPELLTELESTDPTLRTTIALRIKDLLAKQSFVQSIPGHLPGDSASQQRVPRIMQLLRQIAELDT
ncbi:MAG: hypothetical protein WD356_09940 [Pseudomonadales bacterium]